VWLYIEIQNPDEKSIMSSKKVVKRQSVFFILCGTNGTGKTTLVRQLVDSDKKLLVVDPDGMEWNDLVEIDITRVGEIQPTKKARVISPSAEELDYLKDFENGNLVLDDCRYYVKSRIEESIRQTLVRRRQKGIDVYAVGHSLTEIPPTFWVFATHIILFKTKDNPQRLRQNIPNYKEMVEKHIPEINANPSHHYYRIIEL
tara:strand:- start:1465 stop:2067 length:603 start_codon:yes stop_codon:yes gene_type:complete